MSASSRPFTTPRKVLAELQRDPELWKQTWVRKTAEALLETDIATTILHKGQDNPQPGYTASPPWQAPFTITPTWLHSPKASLHPAALRAETLSHLLPLADYHATTIYTDGSVNTESGAAAAAFVTKDVTRQWRLTDGSSSTQTELVAIREALQHLTTTLPPSALIATDSKAALQAIQHPWPHDNVNLITSIRLLASQLQDRGTYITLTWIPGHAQIHGNELADAAAKRATSRPAHDIAIPPSMTQVKQSIKKRIKHLHSAEHAAEVENSSPSATWYSHATNGRALDLTPSTHPRVRADVHRLRLGYPCLSELQEDNPPTFCTLCETPTHKPLLHYILQCTHTQKLRRQQQEYPHPEDPHAREAAARLVAATPSTLLADIVSAAPPP